jgi:hypothetical protein
MLFDYRANDYHLIKNLSEQVGTQLAAFNSTGELLEVRLLILIVVGSWTRKNRHFDTFLAVDSPAKHDLGGEPGTQLASDGEIKPCQSFEQGRFATGLVADDDKLSVHR